MRMWMVNPKMMCRKHLLGEHLELHMFVGCIYKGIRLDGYLDKRILEPMSIKERHEELANEMLRRGYKHNSPLELDKEALDYLGSKKFTKVPKWMSYKEITSRCPICRQLHERIYYGEENEKKN